MAEPLPLLHVVDCLNVGGTERQLFELLRTLDRRRWRPLIACFQQGELSASLDQLGVEVVHFPLHGSLMQLNTGVQMAKMAHLCRRRGIALIHAHDIYSNMIAFGAAQLAARPLIVSRRDLGHWHSLLQRRTLDVVCRLADRILVNAKATGDRITAAQPRTQHKVRVIPNGIDIAAFDRAAEVAAPLPETPPGTLRVAMIASMHMPDKGHGDLLQVAAWFKAQGRSIAWFIVSDGVWRPKHEARARELGVAAEVHFLGRRTDIPSILRRVDLLVHPSWAEGFPNVILEAMCARRAVVATHVGGSPELVVDGKTGLLVPPHAPRQLAAAIEQLLDPTVRERFGEAGRERIVANFSLEKMVANVESLYRELLA